MSLLNIELTLNLQWCFLDDLLKLFLLLDASIFTTIYEKKEKQKSTLQITLKDVTEEKNLEIHKYSWLSIIWILKKLNFLKSNFLTNYLQSKTTFLRKLIKSYIRQPKLSLPSTNLCFILIIALSLFGFELSRVNFSCSHFFSLASFLANHMQNFILFLLDCNTDFTLKSTHSVDC